MDEGRYGGCATCGGALPYGRLLVMPEARTCAACGAG
ncbi:MAG: TraR/DksA C4-type zinc finger protein [Gemmatimonadetes bacterium]|nr:TraR/DksA C4-type zinc finger protein [Gemmatimonadota bacterium]